MAKNTKKVTIAALEKEIKTHCAKSATVKFGEIEIVVIHSIGIKEVVAMVDDIVSMSFLEDGTYMPETLDFAVKVGVLTYYTNLTLPTQLEKRYEITQCEPLFSVIGSHLNQAQLQEIVLSSHKKIAHLNNATTIEAAKSVSALMDSVLDVVGMVRALAEKYTGVLENVDADGLQAVLDVLQNFVGVDESVEDRIVAAYKRAMPSEATVVDFPSEAVVDNVEVKDD